MTTEYWNVHIENEHIMNSRAVRVQKYFDFARKKPPCVINKTDVHSVLSSWPRFRAVKTRHEKFLLAIGTVGVAVLLRTLSPTRLNLNQKFRNTWTRLSFEIRRLCISRCAFHQVISIFRICRLTLHFREIPYYIRALFDRYLRCVHSRVWKFRETVQNHSLNRLYEI